MTEANVELLISRHQSERFKLSARDGGSLLADLLMDNLQNPVLVTTYQESIIRRMKATQQRLNSESVTQVRGSGLVRNFKL